MRPHTAFSALRDRPIKDKLRMVMVITSITGLLLASLAFYANTLWQTRRQTLQHVNALASVIGKDIAVALAFQDVGVAEKTLSALRHQPDVIQTCIFDSSGGIFAAYLRGDQAGLACRFMEQGSEHLLGGHYIDLVRPIVLDEERFGTLIVRYGLNSIFAQLKYHGLITLFILTASIGVILSLSRVLARLISAPILDLAITAEHISRTGDYSIRAERRSNDEIGMLVDGFNAMLNEIQLRDAELAGQNALLENKVNSRTTELKQRNAEIETANRRLEDAVRHAQAMAEKAEDANRCKSQFLANVSHEIRTPLNVMLGFADLLQEGLNTPKENQYATAICTSGRTLLSLINDILDLSKIEAGRMDLELAPADPRHIFDEIIHMFAAKIQAKGLDQAIRIDPQLPPALMLDEVRLRQVLYNLMGNAVKFTERGSINLSILANRIPEPGCIELIIAVADTGVGIAEEMQQEVFEAFQQQAGHGAKYGGTGLGLSISHRLVQMMNGRLTLQSRPNQGSVFTIHLDRVAVAPPLTAARRDPGAHQSLMHLRPATLLIVDDSSQNRMLLKDFLSRLPLTIREAENGRQALTLACRHKFDLVLLDIKMPLVDGHDLVRAIKGDPHLASVPLVAVTAAVMQESLLALRSAGCDGIVKKPIRKEELHGELARWLQAVESTGPGGESTAPAGLSSPSPGTVNPGLGQHERLQRILQHDLLPRFHEIKEAMLVHEIRGFGDTVCQLGLEFGMESFQQWGTVLSESADRFDVQEMMSILEGFPGLFAQIPQGAE